jgi:hypothetical protein
MWVAIYCLRPPSGVPGLVFPEMSPPVFLCPLYVNRPISHLQEAFIIGHSSLFKVF